MKPLKYIVHGDSKFLEIPLQQHTYDKMLERALALGHDNLAKCLTTMWENPENSIHAISQKLDSSEYTMYKIIKILDLKKRKIHPRFWIPKGAKPRNYGQKSQPN